MCEQWLCRQILADKVAAYHGADLLCAVRMLTMSSARLWSIHQVVPLGGATR